MLDTETSGLDPYLGDRMVGFVIGPQHPHVGWYIPVRHHDVLLDKKTVIDWLRTLASDPSRVWILCNAKFDLKMLRKDGIEIAGRVVDVMVAGHVLRGELPARDFGLDVMTTMYVPYFEHTRYTGLMEHLRSTQVSTSTEEGEVDYNYSLVPLDILGPYALEDLHGTRLVADALKAKFRELYESHEFEPVDNHGYQSFSTNELLMHDMELVKALFELEDRGCLVDEKRTVELREKAREEIEQYLSKMYVLAGHNFNPGSWKQLWKAFEQCGGTVKYWMRKEESRGKQKSQKYTEDFDNSTGRPCWNAYCVLLYLHDYEKGSKPYEFVLAYREVMMRQRIVAMYIEHYLKHKDFNGRVHGQFNQHTVITGRLSSSHPNLQNVSKSAGNTDQKVFEKFIGEKDEEAINRKVRSLFIARPGYVWLSLDWSQVEYRCATWLAQDHDMIDQWIANPRIDYHDATVELTGLERDPCKVINFMTLYGGGAAGLAATLTVMGKPTTTAQAKDMLNVLFAKRGSLRKLIDMYSAMARQKGYIQNIFGRICEVPRGFEYKGLNFASQGTIGDWMRRKIVEMENFIQAKKIPAYLILNVHDELGLEVKEGKEAEVVPEIQAEFEKCPWMSIPVPSDAELGYRWSDGIPFEKWIKGERAHVA